MRGSVTPILRARSRFSSVSRISRHCIWPPMQRSATAASTPSGAPPVPIYISTPVLSGSAQWITPATSPSVMSRTAAPVERTPLMISAWRGRSSTNTVIAEGSTPFALGIPGADGHLLHINVGRMQERAAIRYRHGRNRARHVLGAQRGALQRVDGDIDLRAGVHSDLLADKQHRRLVALALADHDRAFDRQLVEFAPHRVQRSLVGRLLVAVTAQPRRRYRRALRHAHDFECENTLQHELRRNGNMGRHRRTP